MSELHKPATRGPWWATPDRLVDNLGWIGGFSVYSGEDGEGEEIAEVFTAANDAAAIADLWCWIERAERYEWALRRILDKPSEWADVEKLAESALRNEGRL